MGSRIFALLFLLIVVFSSLATAVPTNLFLENKQVNATIMGTASEVNFMIKGGTTFFEVFIDDASTTYGIAIPITPSALTLSTFSEISPIWSAGSLLTLSTLVAGSGFTATPTAATSTSIVFAGTTVVTAIATETSITMESLPASIISVTGTTITSLSLTSITSTVIASSSRATSGAVSYATSTSKAAAPTLVVGLGTVLGVAVGAVALL
ncbi:hypothetical protein N431DRAFT_445489 [Stipitochalara longipes BDJ]|nr:hypothetical protein N431DRAFT_445489 [Stipitochalara longipes BDJ]